MLIRHMSINRNVTSSVQEERDCRNSCWFDEERVCYSARPFLLGGSSFRDGDGFSQGWTLGSGHVAYPSEFPGGSPNNN